MNFHPLKNSIKSSYRPSPPFKKYRIWTFQRRFERLSISFSRHQKAHWRHIVRFRTISKKFLDEVDCGDVQMSTPTSTFFKEVLFSNGFKFHALGKSKLFLNRYQISLLFELFFWWICHILVYFKEKSWKGAHNSRKILFSWKGSNCPNWVL